MRGTGLTAVILAGLLLVGGAGTQSNEGSESPSLVVSVQSAARNLLGFTLEKADQIALRYWVPVERVKDVYPETILPAALPFSFGSAPTPSGMVDGFLVLRRGVIILGDTKERGVVDGFFILTANAPAALCPADTSAAILVEYYCSSAALHAALAEVGIKVLALDGVIDPWLRADSQQMVEGKLNVEGRGEWRFRTVTRDLRHFDLPTARMRIFYKVDGELRALDISTAEDFYMRAAGEMTFDSGSPLDRWQGWRTADDHVTYQYGERKPHAVISLAPQPAESKD